MLKIKIFFLLIVLLINCSSNTGKNDDSDNLKENSSPEDIYIIAMNYFDTNNYVNAIEHFNDLEKKYPLSNEAIQAKVMIAFIDYVTLNYDDAILKFNKSKPNRFFNHAIHRVKLK